MLPSIVPVDRLLAESDTVAALASGTCGGPGVGLIAGTGVCALAESAAGQRLLRGGWGYLLGDEGGGYWIGLQALHAAARAEDGRGPKTSLYGSIVQQCGAPDMRGVYKRVYAEEIGQPEIAALAPLVLAASDDGDPVAMEIVDEAAHELMLLVEAICAAAAFTQARERVIVATGGVLRPGNALWRRFAPRVAERLPQFQLLAPRFPPVIGAFLLGLRLAGVALDEEVLTRVEQSQAAIPGLADKSLPRDHI
jgi:N-acetylglucosamine kinase-like BadF-type ATPase